MPSSPPAPTQRNAWHGGAIALVLISFVAIRFLFVHSASPVLHPDSHVYLSEAGQSYGDLVWGVFGAPTWRPVGYPMFLKFCGASNTSDISSLMSVVHIQMLFSGIAFGLAALTASRHLCRTRLGRIAVVTLFALTSLTWFAGPWDAAILSESVSLSCFLLICVLITVAFARKPQSPPEKSDVDGPEFLEGDAANTGRPVRFALTLLVLLPVTAFFLQLRDANVPLVFCLLALLLVHALRRWRSWNGPSRTAACIWFAMIAGLAIFQSRASLVSGRADWPLTNALSIRVLPDPERFDTFASDYSFPRELAPLVGNYAWDGWREQPAYSAWLTDKGRSAFFRFHFSNPGFTSSQTLSAFRFAADDLTSQQLSHYFEPVDGTSPLRLRLCSAVTDLVTLPQRLITAAGGYRALWPITLGLVCVAGVILLRERQAGALYASAFGVLALAVQITATTFLDACEDSRHNLLAYILMVLLFWLPLIIIADDIAARREAGDSAH